MGNVDGSVIIEVKATTDKFEKQLQNLENKYANKEIEIDLTEEQLFNAEQDLKSLNDQVEYLGRQYDEINKKLKEQEEIMARIKATPRDMTTIEGRIASNSLDTQYNRALDKRDAAQRNLWRITEEINKQNDLVINQEAVVSKITAKYEKQKNDLAYINQQISNTEMAQGQINTTVEKTSTAHNKTLKSLTKIGLAVFGIRSAYMFVRQAMSYVLSGNQKLSNQMEGIKSSFYNAFTPVIEKIISGIKTLMAYINYLWKALFGKVLFAEKGTTNMSKNLASGAKSAKEINKQLASFDEANVLSSNKDTGAGGVGGGSNGNYDLGLSNIPIPGWLKWIREFIEEHPTISKIIFGLAAFTLFGGWKIAGGIFDVISSLIGGGTGAGATGLLGVLGILSILTASIWTIKIVYDDAKKFGEEIDNDIEKGKKGLKDWASKEEDIDLLLMNQHNHRLAGYEALKDSSNFLTKIYGLDDERLKQAKSTAEVLKSEVDQEVNLYKQGKTNKRQQDEIKQAILDQVAYNNKLIQKLDWVGEDSTKIRKINEALIQDYKDMGGNVEDVKDNLVGINTIKLDDKKINVAVAVDTSDAQSKLDLLISKTSNAFSKIGAALGGTNTRIKYNANGGIVNLPGRGVPIAHYAGEAGREGIVPIDNEGQMALLGSEIAKRVIINLTNVTEMNGRTISKELKRIGSESDFAFNR